MRFVVILLLSLCHFVTKAHDHTCEVKSSSVFSYHRFTDSHKSKTYVQFIDTNDQNENVIDVDDEDDNDLVSAKKYQLLVKSVILRFYLHLFSDTYQDIHKDQSNCSQVLIIPADKYITQRVLRI